MPQRTGKKVAILQSNYVPWKGYFDIIHSVDEFILYDEVQYTTDDWRNRNLIKTPAGTAWISIPVSRKDHLTKKISEMTVGDRDWARRHWERIKQTYRDAPCFSALAPTLQSLYDAAAGEEFLSAVNFRFLKAICQLLGVTTKLSWSASYPGVGHKTERLVSICSQAGADVYLSGPAARSYIDESEFEKRSMNVEWMDYAGYPEYPQLFGPFTHQVSVLDLLFNTGPDAAFYIWGWRHPT